MDLEGCEGESMPVRALLAAVGSSQVWAGQFQAPRALKAFDNLTWLAAHHRPHGVSSVGVELLLCSWDSTHIPAAASTHHRPTKCQALKSSGHKLHDTVHRWALPPTLSGGKVEAQRSQGACPEATCGAGGSQAGKFVRTWLS